MGGEGNSFDPTESFRGQNRNDEVDYVSAIEEMDAERTELERRSMFTSELIGKGANIDRNDVMPEKIELENGAVLGKPLGAEMYDDDAYGRMHKRPPLGLEQRMPFELKEFDESRYDKERASGQEGR